MDSAKACNILGIDPTFTPSELKKAYYRTALQHHPDKNSSEESTQRFQEITAAYQFLKMVEEDDSSHDDLDYSSLLEKFLRSVAGVHMDKDNLAHLMCEMARGCREISVKAFEGIDKHSALKLFGYVEQYSSFLGLDEEAVEKIRSIVKSKMQNDMLVVLNPSLDNLLSADIYKLEHEGETYYVPLWHDEVTYDLADKSIIAKCIPDLPAHMYVDDHNTLHININTSIEKALVNEAIEVQVGEKVFQIRASDLCVTSVQTHTLKRQGIPVIDTGSVFDASVKSDIVIHVGFNK